jgi:hypothetical protein
MMRLVPVSDVTTLQATRPYLTQVTLTDDYMPQKFLDKVPEVDTTGRPMPQWKRLLIAKQLAEKAQLEEGEKKKVNFV